MEMLMVTIPPTLQPSWRLVTLRAYDFGGWSYSTIAGMIKIDPTVFRCAECVFTLKPDMKERKRLGALQKNVQ